MDSITKTDLEQTIEDFRRFTAGKKYRTIYADPPGNFRTEPEK